MFPLKPGQERILIVGDWGRSPTLRNSAPTPGIGLPVDHQRRGSHVRDVQLLRPVGADDEREDHLELRLYPWTAHRHQASSSRRMASNKHVIRSLILRQPEVARVVRV